MFYVYILRTNENTLYIGQTNNLEKRLIEHQSHSPRSAKHLRRFTSLTLVYHEEFETRGEALSREYSLKKLSKAQKESLVATHKLIK